MKIIAVFLSYKDTFFFFTKQNKNGENVIDTQLTFFLEDAVSESDTFPAKHKKMSYKEGGKVKYPYIIRIVG